MHTICFSLINELLKKHPSKVAIAVSGGADSLCLTHLLSKWCIIHDVQLLALIVDHDLRKESQEEAQEVKNFLQQKNVNALIIKWAGQKPTSNIQNAARNVRYKLLHDACVQHNIKHLFVAHTLNDQAETIIMRIMRGSGIDGLCAMSPCTKYNGINIIRPFLSVDRFEIEKYLNNYGWKWINDPSNQLKKYDRIKARSMLKSYDDEFKNTLIYKRLGLLAENVKRTKSYIDDQVKKLWIKKVTINKDYNFLDLDVSILKLHDEMSLRLLNTALKYFNDKALPTPRLKSVLYVLQKLKDNKNIKLTLMDCVIHKIKNKILIYLEIGKNSLNLKLNINEYNLFRNIKLRVYQSNLSASYLDKDGWRKLKDLGFVKPQLLPIEVMHSLIAINNGHELVGVPQIEYFKSSNKSIVEIIQK